MAAAPASAGMTTVDFKYNSLTHLGFQKSVVQTTATPAETVDQVANFLRSSGASVTSINESSVQLMQTVGDRECERWSHSIFQAEFAAFNANSIRQYRRIDRTQQPASCGLSKPSWLQYGYSAVLRSGGSGFQLTAVVDRSVNFSQRVMRPAFSSIFGSSFSANVWSMVPSDVTSNVNFETEFLVIIWRSEADSKTSVFALAAPRSGGVASGPGASIGYAFRGLADGQIETVAAQSLLTYVVQKALVRSATSSTRPADKGGN
jgi:hypothetical protein